MKLEFEPTHIGLGFPSVSQMLQLIYRKIRSITAFQSMMNEKLSQQRFWPCHENKLIYDDFDIARQPVSDFQVIVSLLCVLRIA